jgi:hypothetical protein
VIWFCRFFNQIIEPVAKLADFFGGFTGPFIS